MATKAQLPDRENLLTHLEYLEECAQDCNELLMKWNARWPKGNSTSAHAVTAVLALEAAMRRQIRSVKSLLGEDQLPF